MLQDDERAAVRNLLAGEASISRGKRGLIGQGEQLTKFFAEMSAGAVAFGHGLSGLLGVNPLPDAVQKPWDDKPRAQQVAEANRSLAYYLATIDHFLKDKSVEKAMSDTNARYWLASGMNQIARAATGLAFADPLPEPIISPNITGGRIPLFATHGDYVKVMRDVFISLRYLRDWAIEHAADAALGTHGPYGNRWGRYLQAVGAYLDGIAEYVGVTSAPSRAVQVLRGFRIFSKDVPWWLHTMQGDALTDCWTRLDAHWDNALFLEFTR